MKIQKKQKYCYVYFEQRLPHYLVILDDRYIINMRKLFTLLIGITLLSGCASTTDPVLGNPTPEEIASGIQKLDADTFKEGISRRRIQLVDVRTPEEYEAGHIKKATNIDFLADNFEKEIQKVNKDRPVFIYCRSGGRSGRAAELMKKLGFKKVYDLRGGYLSWVEE